MALAVNHTQRLIVQAIDTLSQLEGRLKTRMNVPDVITKVDELIASLQELVARASEGEAHTAQSVEQAQQELAQEAQVRGRGQEGRLCAG